MTAPLPELLVGDAARAAVLLERRRRARARVKLPELHVGQRRIRAQILEALARFVVIMCGRRWGKTTDAIEWIADGALKGLPCAWMAPTYKFLEEAWRELRDRLRPIAVEVSEQQHRIVLEGGGSIECWTMDTPDPGRTRKYARVVIDEAGIVRDLLEIWQSSVRPTLVDLRGEARFYGTPKGRQHGFVTLFAKGEAREPGWCACRAPTKDNPYISPEEIEAARRDMPPAVFAQEFEGVPADDGANPFGLDAIRAAMVPQLSSQPPVVWGWDFARAQDWTVGIALDLSGTVCRFERWQQIPWGETKARIIARTHRTLCSGDSTGVGDSIVEDLQRAHVPMTGVPFTQKSKQMLMERLAGAIQEGEVHFPDGVIRTELEVFEYEYTAHGVRYTAPDGLHDDCVMALALAVHAYDAAAFGIKWRRSHGQQEGPELSAFDPKQLAVDAERQGRFLQTRAKAKKRRGFSAPLDEHFGGY